MIGVARVPSPVVVWCLCQGEECPTRVGDGIQHHVRAEALPGRRFTPERCPECGGELRAHLIYGRWPEGPAVP